MTGSRRLRAVLCSALLAALAAGGPSGCAVVPDARPAPTLLASASAPIDAARASGRTHPWHRRIVATTFWVGEVFDPDAPDGSQVISTYDGGWYRHYGGCDGRIVRGVCRTERRTSAAGWFPTRMTPKQNPFYLDLPFDDVNDPKGFATRGAVIPWAHDPRYRKRVHDPHASLMKNRWVELRRAGRTCFGQIEDAGPGQYHDSRYVFGNRDQRPANRRYGGAGMDVSPALNGCLGFRELDGDGDRVAWRFVEGSAVPKGPWRRVVTRSGVS